MYYIVESSKTFEQAAADLDAEVILASMAVQFMADGLLDLFPGLSH